MKINLLFKNITIKFLIYLILTIPSFAAGTSGNNGESKKTNYDKASYVIKKAKRFEEKKKLEKAKKQYQKAIKYLQKSNQEKPNQPDTLNYLGFALRKIGNFEDAEKYYLEGLAIKPDHNGINEYLGELYIQTNRMNLAKERLNVLINCNCEEYDELKTLIENN
mgnify:CR=1 FL=1